MNKKGTPPNSLELPLLYHLHVVFSVYTITCQLYRSNRSLILTLLVLWWRNREGGEMEYDITYNWTIHFLTSL